MRRAHSSELAAGPSYSSPESSFSAFLVPNCPQPKKKIPHECGKLPRLRLSRSLALRARNIQRAGLFPALRYEKILLSGWSKYWPILAQVVADFNFLPSFFAVTPLTNLRRDGVADRAREARLRLSSLALSRRSENFS
jgi:hypothetical protein